MAFLYIEHSIEGIVLTVMKQLLMSVDTLVIKGAVAVLVAFALWAAVATAHPPSSLGLYTRAISVEHNADEASVLIDLEVTNRSGKAKTLRGFRLIQPKGQLFWTRGKFDVTARFARIEAGETWWLGNRFNPLRVQLEDTVVLDRNTPIVLELDFGRDDVDNLILTLQGGMTLDFSDEKNWFTW